ncbi:MAG: polymer-forming cytoskeletal protein [Bacteroidota bacterium]
MFGTKAKPQSDKIQPKNANGISLDTNSCVIASGTVIEGKVYASEDVRLDGIIVGDLISEKRLVMGDKGRVDGTAICNGSSIKGKIEGELSVNGTLHLSESAFVAGKIKAKKLVVDEGASYSGECLIGEQHFK